MWTLEMSPSEISDWHFSSFSSPVVCFFHFGFNLLPTDSSPIRSNSISLCFWLWKNERMHAACETAPDKTKICFSISLDSMCTDLLAQRFWSNVVWNHLIFVKVVLMALGQDGFIGPRLKCPNMKGRKTSLKARIHLLRPVSNNINILTEVPAMSMTQALIAALGVTSHCIAVACRDKERKMQCSMWWFSRVCDVSCE